MKLNLEIELDWIDEEMNLDETVKQHVIEAVVNRVQEGIEKKVENKINQTIDTAVLAKINEKTETLFNEFMDREICISDKYGDKIKVYPNMSALIK